MTTHRSTCALITGGTTAGVLLLALVALLWAGGDPQQHGATGARLGLFRRPATAQDLEEGGLNKQQQSPHGPREAGTSLRRRPGQEFGATDVLWGLEPGCLAALYGAQHEGDCGCSTVISTNDTDEGSPPRLTFVDPDAITLWPAGGTVRATLRARHKCSDVVNAAFHSPGAFNVLGRDVTVPARVLALDTGDYAVLATLRHAGTYTLKVRKGGSLGVRDPTITQLTITHPPPHTHQHRRGSSGKASPRGPSAARAAAAAATRIGPLATPTGRPPGRSTSWPPPGMMMGRRRRRSRR